MAGAPDKWAFVKNGLNVVDVISILPFYIDLFFLQPPDTLVFSKPPYDKCMKLHNQYKRAFKEWS